MEAKLVVLSGKAQGNEIPLPSSQFVIGRGSSCHLRPHSELVSKLHCVIGRRAGHVVVRDLKSANQTYVNDKPITGPTAVQDGDILSVGPLNFRFAITETSGSSLIQKIEEDDVHWLMKESADSFVMDSDYETKVIHIPPHLMKDVGDPAATDAKPADDANEPVKGNTGDSKLSAGKYLHEYFESQDDGAELDTDK
jgi:pSer/pThr/pTyr-binding forkhead associated (FHA) protein